MAEFVLCDNYFEFSEVFQQISGTAVSTKFAPPYTGIYMQTWMGKVSIALAHAILLLLFSLLLFLLFSSEKGFF